MRLLQRVVTRLKGPPAPFEPARLVVDGKDVTVRFRRNAAARRLILRLGRAADEVVVTVPRSLKRSAALAFAENSTGWIAARLTARPVTVPFAAGSVVPLRGVPHEVRQAETRRGLVRLDAAERVIWVPGDPAHMARRLTVWLKAEALSDLQRSSRHYAAAMGVSFRRLALRDQKSRWGSCTAAGDLSYSWRLVFAPPEVLDYVAAHEVAHLKHMDHSPRFWRLVLTHCAKARLAKVWLKRHAGDVHRYG